MQEPAQNIRLHAESITCGARRHHRLPGRLRDTCRYIIKTESATVHCKNCLLDNVQRLITSTRSNAIPCTSSCAPLELSTHVIVGMLTAIQDLTGDTCKIVRTEPRATLAFREWMNEEKTNE